jgi:hypothetical protein
MEMHRMQLTCRTENIQTLPKIVSLWFYQIGFCVSAQNQYLHVFEQISAMQFVQREESNIADKDLARLLYLERRVNEGTKTWGKLASVWILFLSSNIPNKVLRFYLGLQPGCRISTKRSFTQFSGSCGICTD